MDEEQKVPLPKFYLVGGYLRDDTPRHDIDIVGVLDDNAFKYLFGYDHKSLLEAYKQKPPSEKFIKYKTCNRVTSWVLTLLFKKYVDFKWVPPSMLHIPNDPHLELHLEADVTMYL